MAVVSVTLHSNGRKDEQVRWRRPAGECSGQLTNTSEWGAGFKNAEPGPSPHAPRKYGRIVGRETKLLGLRTPYTMVLCTFDA